jgi:FkbM family methyltransferase
MWGVARMVTTARSDYGDYREGRRFILCDLIYDAGLVRTPIVVLDVGARDAFGHMRWTALPPDMVRLHGFEPDPQECDALNRKARAEGLDFHFHPIALAEHTGLVDFYSYAEQAANSCYPANRAVVERFCYARGESLASQFELIERRAIAAKSVADWVREAGVAEIDFCKLNIQGGELNVLRGAGPLLGSVLGLFVEQTFSATYVGAPLFGEVYEFIRTAGFSMFDIPGINRLARTRSPIHLTEDRIFSINGRWPLHQVLEGHFLYFRDPILAADEWSPGSPSLEQCIKLACIAELFGQLEFAFELLSWIAASSQAGGTASLCREIVGRGVEVYRAASQMEVLPAAGSLEAENKRLAADLSAQASQVTRLEAGLETWIKEATRVRAECAAQASQVERLEAGLDAWMREAMRLRVEVGAQANETTGLRAEHAAEVSQATQLEAAMESWTREAIRLRAELAVQASQATQVVAELAACKGEVANLTKERQDLYASTSWRVTAPLRGAKALVSWILRKLGWRR